MKRRGFTLLEVLLAVTLISLLGSFSIPIWRRLQVRSDLDLATNLAAQSFRRAQVLSRAGEGDTSWGVYVQAGSITVFKGTSYAGRDSSFDEAIETSWVITPSGTQEVVFSRIFGLPQTTGTLTLTSLDSNVRTVTINAKGMVDY